MNVMLTKETTLTPQKEFACSFYYEHLEEASFLYEQRLTLLDNPEFTWFDIEDFETRFEAHIDALVIGEDLALEVCKQQATEGDFGELHAAIHVFCRQNRLDSVKEILDKLDAEDEEGIKAVSDALNHELPANWQNEFIHLLSEGDEKLVPILAKLIGYQRLSARKELLQALQKSSSDALPTILWAIGRHPDLQAIPLLSNYIHHEDESICYASALALLRIGEQKTISECLRYADVKNWPLIPLGLGGDASTVSALLQIASSSDKVSHDCLIALGLLGDVSAAAAFLYYLKNAKFVESAAMAMNLITGAELYEEVFIPEEIDEDELFEEELEKLKKGEPLYPPGEEPGVTITRISQNPEEWDKWWSVNKNRFRPGIRYRNGKPYSPASLLENLEYEKTPHRLRQLAYEELVIRYRIDFPFETDMFVVQQKQAIARYKQWLRTNSSLFKPGQWYFKGRLIRPDIEQAHKGDHHGQSPRRLQRRHHPHQQGGSL